MTDRYSDRYTRSPREGKGQEVKGKHQKGPHQKGPQAFRGETKSKSSGYVTRERSDGLALEC